MHPIHGHHFEPQRRLAEALVGIERQPSWSSHAGLGNSLTTLLEEFSRIQSTDVLAPTTDNRTLRLRCVVRPDRTQSILLDRLGLTLSHRLKLPRGLSEM